MTALYTLVGRSCLGLAGAAGVKHAPMLLGTPEIRRLVPHQGEMCLIAAVEAWDERAIVCIAASHRSPANPLRRDGRLAGLHAFEYGAQAAAVHGGLLAGRRGERPALAYLGAIRDGVLQVERLDCIADDLRIAAELVMGDAGSAVYRCRIDAGSLLLAQARLTLVFTARMPA